MSFSHYILCRYNLTLFSENVYGILDPAGWMERRRYYFDWLIMSLGVQTCKNFHFVLFMDEKTPKEYIIELEESISKAVETYEIYLGHWNDWIAETDFKSDWIITSRIDCDDYYNENFVKIIQDNFKGKQEILDVYGVQYDQINDELYTSGRERPNSPFISLVERNKDVKTVFYKPHTYMGDEFPARFVGSEPLYTQVIHDENISNKIIGKKL